jgi:hypothetical protein
MQLCLLIDQAWRLTYDACVEDDAAIVLPTPVEESYTSWSWSWWMSRTPSGTGDGPHALPLLGNNAPTIPKSLLVGSRTERDDRDLARALWQEYNVHPNLGIKLVRSTRGCAERIWLIDNCSSMETLDSCIIVPSSGGDGVALDRCSRWKALGNAIRWHGQLAMRLGAPTTFQLLNLAADNAPRSVSLGIAGEDREFKLAELERLIASRPQCVDPEHTSSESLPAESLAEGISKVVTSVRARADTLREESTNVVIVISTDRKPSDATSVVRALEMARSLPLSVVLRYCASDREVEEAWEIGVEEVSLFGITPLVSRLTAM